jgi:diamine N-acetyltransferase
MITYKITGYELPTFADDSYCILRLMIDKQYQNRGYGGEAMKNIMAFIRTFPAGPAKYCWISYKTDNIAAKKLYESFGFRDSDETCENEPITVLRL